MTTFDPRVRSQPITRRQTETDTVGTVGTVARKETPPQQMHDVVVDAGTPVATTSALLHGNATEGSTLRAGGFSPTPTVQAARAAGAPAMAELLHGIATKKLFANEDKRLAQVKELFDGLSAAQVDDVKAAYVKQYGADPELHIRSWGVAQPLAPFSDATVREMIGAMNGPRLAEIAQTLRDLAAKANTGTLTQADRKQYFAMMPMMGLWNEPHRPEAKSLDSLERGLLKDKLGADLDATMKTIEAKLPRAEIATGERKKSIAVVVSSAGAQWQELMGWAQKMHDDGYTLQLFTPNGRPVAFRRTRCA